MISARTGAGLWKLHWAFRYGFALFIVATAAVARHLLREQLAALPYAVFYPAILLVASLAGVGPAMFATVTAAACAQIPIILVSGTFAGENTSDIIRLLAFITLATVSAVALALLRAGRLDDAIVQFRKSLEMNPRDAEIQQALGAALQQKRQRQMR